MKKILSVILAVVMLLGCMSITAFAEDSIWEIQGDAVVKYIGGYICTELIVPDGIKTFGNEISGVFEGRDDIYTIRYLRLPESIPTITENALKLNDYENINIRYLCVGWTNSDDIPACPKIDSSDEAPTLVVPNGTKALYQNSAGWKDLNIIEVWDIDENGVLKEYYGPIFGEELTVPTSVKKIGDYALEYVYYEKIVVPEGVTEIGIGAFSWCSDLKSVTFPKSLTTINRYIFGQDGSLTEITLGWDTADSIVPLGSNPFGSKVELSDITIYVPYGTKALYENHPYWGQCGNIIELAHTHDFTGEYKDNGDGTHSRKCTVCGELGIPEAHNYLNGVCVCGAKIHTHDYTYSYVDNGDGTHSGKCECGDVSPVKVAHSYDSTGTCVCGNKVTVLRENYLVEGHEPIANGASGLYNARTYYMNGNNKIVLNEKLYNEDKSVTFEQWYLRTMVQYKHEGDDLRLRFVTMLDENLDDYEEAGFTYSVEGAEDKLFSTEGYTSFVTDGTTHYISEYSQADDYFVMQNTLFAKEVVDANPEFTVTPYVKLIDGTVLTGKTVTFHLTDFVK